MQWDVGINEDWPNAANLTHSTWDDESAARQYIADQLDKRYPGQWIWMDNHSCNWRNTFGILARPGRSDLLPAIIWPIYTLEEQRARDLARLYGEKSALEKLLLETTQKIETLEQFDVR